MKIKFRSRISVLILIFISFVLLFDFISDPFNYLPIHLVLLFLLSFIILCLAGSQYIITDQWLISKLWFITFDKININDIQKIERSYFPISANAASLKRLELTIKTARGRNYYCLISPVNEKKFLEHIKKINPPIVIEVINKKNFFRIWDWDI